MNAPDAVLSFHVNPDTCGVARFSQQLATQLGVPFGGFDAIARYQHPLISLKASELQTPLAVLPATYDLFLHEWQNTPREQDLLIRARTVWAANLDILSGAVVHRRDVRMAWCPGTLPLKAKVESADVFTFGMGHKVNERQHARLRVLLDATSRPYTVLASMAVHDGHAFGATCDAATRTLRQVYGAHFRFLGYLSDEAVVEELQSTTYVAVLFPHGARANNTTLMSALAAGAIVITNLDRYSPPELVHMKNVIDLNVGEVLPTDHITLARVRLEALLVGREVFGWAPLVRRVTHTPEDACRVH